MIKAVIFDMDGLLVNSEPLWDEVDQSLLRKRGHIFSASIRLKRIGIGQHATVELFKKEFDLTDKVSELLSERQKHFKKLFTKNPVLMEGTLEIIELFYSIGIKMGIATGGCDENSVKHLFKHFAIEKKFHSITTSHEVANGKPAPDIFLLEAKN